MYFEDFFKIDLKLIEWESKFIGKCCCFIYENEECFVSDEMFK